MNGPVARVQARIQSLRERGSSALERNRVRWPWFDHLVRTVHRYQVQKGDRLAGGVTYFAFLSFFPIIALAFAVFGYATTVRPSIIGELTSAINDQLPGLAAKIDLKAIADARAGAGLIGLVGLLYAGLGAIDALRDALRSVGMSTRPEPNFFVAKLRDVVALLLIGVTLVFSAAVSGVATGLSGTVTGWLGLSGSPLSTAGLWIAGSAVSLLADMLVFLVILRWLAQSRQPWPVLLKGALLGAAGFWLLKRLATLLLAHTLTNPVYSTVAVVVGLLVWINLSARVVLYSAAWTATAGYGPPPQPTPLPGPEMDPKEAAT